MSTLQKLGYDDDDRIIFIRCALHLVICGVSSSAQTDICVTDDNEILLLVQENSISESYTSRRCHHISRHHYGHHQPYLLQNYRHGPTELRCSAAYPENEMAFFDIFRSFPGYRTLGCVSSKADPRSWLAQSHSNSSWVFKAGGLYPVMDCSELLFGISQRCFY